MSKLSYNFLLDCDSYKLSHRYVYPKNIQGMFSYGEARIKDETMIMCGLQIFIKNVLSNPITTEMIDEAEKFSQSHGEPFDRSDWDYIVSEYNGYIPITIRAVPEGTPVKSQNVLYSIECTDPRVFWLSSFTETCIQRAVWYPTTIASNDYKIKQNLIKYYEISGADKNLLPFALHDFGGRGVSSEESAQIGGFAHLVNFMGSDTMSGIRAANFYYNSPMAAFSVPASEHTIQTSYGESEEEQVEYLRTMIQTYGKPGAILSIVIDGYDTFREANTLCTVLKDEIIASGAKVVFRPDSGDPMDIVPKLLKMQEAAFGYTLNTKGFKKINNVGIIQGDGVDALLIDQLMLKITNMHYAADNIVFGSGGALLQKVNRDTYKFAQKASAIFVDGVWKPIKKNPITDPGKKSKAGRIELWSDGVDFINVNKDTSFVIPGNFKDIMITVYNYGCVTNEISLDQVRANTGLW